VRCLSELEVCKGTGSKEQMSVILSNLFRTVIVLVPHELTELYNFLSVQLAPEYEGIETNMGIEGLFKSIAKATGVPKKQVKQEFLSKGDLG
jgi:DNA ligase-1